MSSAVKWLSRFAIIKRDWGKNRVFFYLNLKGLPFINIMDGCFLHIFFSSQYFTIIFSVLVLFSAMTTIYWNPINRAYVTRSNFEYFFSTFYSKVSDKIMDKIKKLKYEKNNDKMNIKFKNSGMFAVVVDDSVAVKNSNISFTKWKISN